MIFKCGVGTESTEAVRMDTTYGFCNSNSLNLLSRFLFSNHILRYLDITLRNEIWLELVECFGRIQQSLASCYAIAPMIVRAFGHQYCRINISGNIIFSPYGREAWCSQQPHFRQ